MLAEPCRGRLQLTQLPRTLKAAIPSTPGVNPEVVFVGPLGTLESWPFALHRTPDTKNLDW